MIFAIIIILFMIDLSLAFVIRIAQAKNAVSSVQLLPFPSFFSHLLIHFNKPKALEREHVNMNVVDDSQTPCQAE